MSTVRGFLHWLGIRRRRATALTAVVVAAMSAPAAAADLEGASGREFRLHGYGSVGVTAAEGPPGWGLRRDVAQPPNSGGMRADIDSRLGLQATYAISPSLELAAQAVLKRQPHSAAASELIEGAYLAYRPAAPWALRLGRTSPDLFLMSDHRNVGFAYAPARPPIDFYSVLPLSQIDGVDLSRDWAVGNGSLRLKGFYGRSRYHLDAAPIGPTRATLSAMRGLVLSHESAGLRLRATVGRARVSFPVTGDRALALAAIDQLQNIPIAQVANDLRALRTRLRVATSDVTYGSLGFAYEHDRWLLGGELMRIGGDVLAMTSRGAYLSLGRRVGDVTLTTGLGALRSLDPAVARPQWGAALAPLQPFIGSAGVRQVQLAGTSTADFINALRVDQRSLSLGLRWDIDPQVAMKLQWDHVRVRADGGLLWTGDPTDGGHVNVGSFQIDFIF